MNRVYGSSQYANKFNKPRKPKGKKFFFVSLIIIIFLIYIATGDAVRKNVFEKPQHATSLSRATLSLYQQEGGDNAEAVEGSMARMYKISEGDIPAEVFSEHAKFDANDMASLISASKDVYDFTNIRIGQDLRFYFNGGDKAERVEYDQSTESMIIVERSGKDFSVREEKIAYEISQENISAEIDEFFYKDALDAGLSDATTMQMSDVFSFSVDFMTDIRIGDSFSVVYEKRKRDGKEAPDGLILAAKFINDGNEYFAFYFDNNGEGGYYDAEGHALERQFLAAPLSYRRITSGFTGTRRHPITKSISAHYQIDYAAPTGTPVVASARGTVSSAGWENGWGYIVRLRHDNGYTTHYAHLSSFASGIRSGQRVFQGEVVGYVGSTGWSTGPHLDYGMKLNGSPINPLTLKQPKGAPLGENKMAEFEKVKNQFASLLK